MAARPIYSLGLPQETTKKLTQCGYETLEDLLNASADSLAADLAIPIQEAERIIVTSKGPSSTPSITSTQSVASMAKHRQPFSTQSCVVDSLLQGGLIPGHILEISGPPGTPREKIATGVASSVAAAGQEVIFVDMQNMSGYGDLLFKTDLAGHDQLLSYIKMHELTDLLAFFHNLPSLLERRPKTALLVFNSISFPFQSSKLNTAAKLALFERIKKSLATTTLSKNISVVITSQLATKILKSDGTVGNFDTGARGVMVPQLGQNYLPSGRTFRIVLGADGPATGFIRLLSSPRDPPGTNAPLPLLYALDAEGKVQLRDHV